MPDAPSRFPPVRPRGTKITRQIKLPATGSAFRPCRVAARYLDRTLGDGDFGAVDTRIEEVAYVSHISQKPSAEYDPRQRLIRIAPTTSRPMSDWIHEVGHVLYIDQIIPAKRRVGGTLLQGFEGACDRSEAGLHLKNVQAAFSYYPNVQRDIDYLLDPEELFARALSQFVAVRSQDAAFEDEVWSKSLQGGADLPLFWSADDFTSVDLEMRTLLRKMGWIER
jgi:hypothetical protein